MEPNCTIPKLCLLSIAVGCTLAYTVDAAGGMDGETLELDFHVMVPSDPTLHTSLCLEIQGNHSVVVVRTPS